MHESYEYGKFTKDMLYPAAKPRSRFSRLFAGSPRFRSDRVCGYAMPPGCILRVHREQRELGAWEAAPDVADYGALSGIVAEIPAAHMIQKADLANHGTVRNAGGR
jgi:hypothetical protein